MERPVVLTIAGSDSGGGAGIQADLKTFTVLGVYGTSVITSVTAQNTEKITGIFDIPAWFVELQLHTVLSDIKVSAVKIGMLSLKETVEVVVKTLRKFEIEKIILDPVMVSKTGVRLLKKDAEELLKKMLLPLSWLVTPNIPEAEIISGIKIENIEDMKKSAQIIYEMGAKNVLIKGGHLKETADDILYDGNEFILFKQKKIETPSPHGTGCTYASAITSFIAHGYNLKNAIEHAKTFITHTIKNSFRLGKGFKTVDQLWKIAF